MRGEDLVRRRENNWLIGMGVAAAFRNNIVTCRQVHAFVLARDGIITIETDMTDIGTGSYTIIAQTAAEMMGLDH
jgi:xanthine dehydrogenase YagR molybdenum-binding subunit